MRYYLITGRNYGDWEDLAMVFHADNPEQAQEQFITTLAENWDIDAVDCSPTHAQILADVQRGVLSPSDPDVEHLLDHHESLQIYINTVADCGTHRPTILT